MLYNSIKWGFCRSDSSPELSYMLLTTEYVLLILEDIKFLGKSSYGVPGNSSPIPTPPSLCIILPTSEPSLWCLLVDCLAFPENFGAV